MVYQASKPDHNARPLCMLWPAYYRPIDSAAHMQQALDEMHPTQSVKTLGTRAIAVPLPQIAASKWIESPILNSCVELCPLSTSV